MRNRVSSFPHPVAFWIGCVAIVAGVLSHAPMLVMAAHMGWHMAGMPMDGWMLAGMGSIVAGLAAATYGLLPDRQDMPLSTTRKPLRFHVADGVPLNSAHAALLLALAVALSIDVMKPATLGFVVPGLSAEYRLSPSTANLLALAALTGTTLGSVLWGRLADRSGRRAAILLSALMFMGTSICGAMPAFGWNLAMCFLMGVSAGGLLPIAFTLMAETIPTAHRGWVLVALGGIGTAAGYLLAAGAASIIEPVSSWRALWLLGLPTGACILLLSRFLPESPRYLSSVGRDDEARAVLARFSTSDGIERDDATHPGAPVIDERHPVMGLRQLLRGRHASITWGLVLCGLAWGVVNFGFVLWLPVNLVAMGIDAGAASTLLARSALLSLPGIAVVVWMYHYWSSIGALVVFVVLTALSLLAFVAMALSGAYGSIATISATAALLVSVSGVIAMLIPYATEIFPVQLRGTGSGVVAAASKFGGILGAGLGVLGFFSHIALSACVLAVIVLVSAWLLRRNGIETRGQALEAIQVAIAGSGGRDAGS